MTLGNSLAIVTVDKRKNSDEEIVRDSSETEEDSSESSSSSSNSDSSSSGSDISEDDSDSESDPQQLWRKLCLTNTGPLFLSKKVNVLVRHEYMENSPSGRLEIAIRNTYLYKLFC